VQPREGYLLCSLGTTADRKQLLKAYVKLELHH